MAETILAVSGIRKSFGDLEILRGIDLSVQAGESVAIVGPSGSGKSTLLHIAGLMERPTAGRVSIAGIDADKLDDSARSERRLETIGFLFQFHYLLPDFDVLENVLMPARIAGDDLGRAEKNARALLERLGLGARLTHRPYQLSGGEQQRAGLARALMRKPRLLLCDEPTGNLDPHTAEEVSRLIFSEGDRSQVAVVVVTHNQNLADRAKRVVRINEGILQPEGEAVV